MRARLAFVAFASLLTSGCLELNFDPPSIIKGPRILAMSADPPEAYVGEDVRFEALIVDGDGDDLSTQDGVEVRWTICLSLDAIFDAANLVGSAGGDDCDRGGEDLIVLEHDGAPNRAILRAETLTERLMELPRPDPMAPPPDPGVPGLDPELLETLAEVIAEVGIPLEVTVTVSRDGAFVMAGFKRFAFTTRPGAGTNPPPPRFSIGETEVSARGGGDPHACVTADGSTPVVEPAVEVILAPDPDEEAWLETYPVFDLQGEVIENHETAYYSWFSTGGGFSPEISQRPERDTTWTTPSEAGAYPLFVVVRDGHLGISWCRADVEVR